MNLHLLDRVLAQPWAIRRESIALFSQMVIGQQRLEEKAGAQEEQAGSWEPPPGYVPLSESSALALRYDPVPMLPPGVSVFLVWGVLGRGWTIREKYWFDAIDVDDLMAAINEAPPGNAIVLWFRSPGGIITGIPEAAAFLRELAATRRVIAYTDDLCASAAYWLASQCGSVVASPTANVGSIGVYSAFYDFTKYLEDAGIKLNLFKAGRLKATGIMGSPLSKEAEEHIQAGVDEGYRLFTADVLMNRELNEETMQGQVFRGDGARKVNLVDSFASSFVHFLNSSF